MRLLLDHWSRPKADICPLLSAIASLAKARSFETHSLHFLQQLPRFTQKRPNLSSFGDRFPCEQAMRARVLVCLWRAGSLCAAVHAAALPAVHRWRAARVAGTCFGTTTRAYQHRAGVAGVIAHGSRLLSAEARRRLEPAAFGAFRAADAGLVSDTITFACWVTLPTMALPPSPTDTFCTVMAGSPWLRWRLSASIWAGKVRARRPKARAALSCWAISSAFAR